MTAVASTWAASWRRSQRPSSSRAVTIWMRSPSLSGAERSRSSPSTLIPSAARARPSPMARAASAPLAPSGSSSSVPSGRWTFMRTCKVPAGARGLPVLKRVESPAQEEHGVVEHGERLGLGHWLLGLLVEGALERGQRRYRRGGHEPRTQRVPGLAEIFGDRLEQQLMYPNHDPALEVGHPLVLAAQPLAQERLVLLGHPLVEHRVEPAPERVEGGLAGQAVA